LANSFEKLAEVHSGRLILVDIALRKMLLEKIGIAVVGSLMTSSLFNEMSQKKSEEISALGSRLHGQLAVRRDNGVQKFSRSKLINKNKFLLKDVDGFRSYDVSGLSTTVNRVFNRAAFYRGIVARASFRGYIYNSAPLKELNVSDGASLVKCPFQNLSECNIVAKRSSMDVSNVFKFDFMSKLLLKFKEAQPSSSRFVALNDNLPAEFASKDEEPQIGCAASKREKQRRRGWIHRFLVKIYKFIAKVYRFVVRRF